MTTLEPDQSAALGFKDRPGRDVDPETIDGTITDDPAVRPPLVLGDRDFHSVTETICGWVENKTPKWWPIAFGISSTIAGIGTILIVYLFITGVGVWGLNNPVAWGWAIVNFVWWVGIGHAGTLISAILCIFKQKWRTSINRFAEAMTIFAVICAGTFPGIHVGRVWMAWMLFPLPNSNAIWPNFRSPLLWDVFAVGTYFTVSLLFWYMGMIPDIATLRDRATLRKNRPVTLGPLWAPHPLPKFIATKTITLPINMIASYVYGFLALGWRFSARHWHEYEKAYLLFAGVATPLVLSVHSVVSFDFAVSILPGWHTTIFPPYFVAGAIFSGFAMVLTLLIPAQDAFIRRAFGPYWWAYAAMFFCNVLSPQVFWFKKARTTVWFIFIISIVVNIGMWFERFVIVTTLSSDFLPSSWAFYEATQVDIWTFIGTLGIFMTLFLLFARFLPMLAISEVKNVMPQAHAHLHAHDDEEELAPENEPSGKEDGENG